VVFDQLFGMRSTKQFVNSLLIDIQYFGTINYNKILFQYSNIIFEQYETYQKMSFRNRMVVAGSNGPVNLSVPLEKGRGQKILMKDVKISYRTPWQQQQIRTLRSCYNRAPFFEFYQHGVENLINLRKEFLLDLNLAALDWLQKTLKSDTPVSLSENYQNTCPAGCIDARNKLLPKNYPNSPMGFDYTQVFAERTGFLPNLSILDLLFNCGPASSRFLQDNILTI
jgi:hypothetical protein